MATHSKDWENARKAWLDKEEQYKQVLETSTNFYELEKALYILDYLKQGSSSLDCVNEEVSMRKEMLEEACLDAEFKVLEVCSEFAKKRILIEVARNEAQIAQGNFDELQKSEEVA
tara:strand:- start:1198 stop:1545 length:348 start_codon:yes stop_codon:yes gene_type:complete